MTLSKRYSRSFKYNCSFYVSSTVLTIATLFLFFMMNLAGNSISDFGKHFFSEQKREDANFTTYNAISYDDIDEIEAKYNVSLENQLFVNIDTDGITARVFKKNHKVNLYEVTVGRDVKADDEIIMSEGYSVENGIKVDDTITIGKKDYKIVGFFQRPDYLYMVENTDDAYKNITSFYLAYMTDSEFDSLGNHNSIYQVRYDGAKDLEFRKYINKQYIMRSYLSADDNQRITMVDVQAQLFIQISYIVLCVMPLVAVILISVIISRKVKSEQKIIGTLSALGYKKSKLMLHYVGFAMIPGIVGGLFTVILSVIFAQPFGELGLQDYEPLRIHCSLDPVDALIGIIVPTCMYVIAAIISVRRLLKKDTVLLLNGNSDADKRNLKGILKKKKISFRIKYAIRSLIGNPARTFVVFLGIFLGSFIVLLGFSFVDAMDYAIDNSIDDLGSYQYQYILNEMLEDESYGGEPVLMLPLEEDNGKSLSFIGINASNPYLNLVDVDGEKADVDDGYYITSIAARLSDVKKGDKITLTNPLTNEEYKIKIAGIIDNDMQKAVYTNLNNVSKVLGVSKDSCNVIMSDEQLDIPESKLVQTIKKSDSGDQIETIIDQMGIMVYFVIGLGIVICVASIYVAVNMLVTENRSNISMLKVLGYRDRGINAIVLRINHVLLPIGILVSIPVVYASGRFFFLWMAEFIGMFIKPSVSVRSYIISILITGVSYFGSLLLVSRKVKKIDMVESLKDNRE